MISRVNRLVLCTATRDHAAALARELADPTAGEQPERAP